jgi:phage/plasmid primase-like uncharacterized protein
MPLLPQYKRIARREISLAKEILGLTSGNDPKDPKRQQPCPICGGYDSFYFVESTPSMSGKFHCQQCDFSGNLYNLICKVKNVECKDADAIISQVIESRKRPKKPRTGIKQGRRAPGALKLSKPPKTPKPKQDEDFKFPPLY